MLVSDRIIKVGNLKNASKTRGFKSVARVVTFSVVRKNAQTGEKSCLHSCIMKQSVLFSTLR